MTESTITLRVAGLDDEGKRIVALFDAGFDDALITQDRAGGTGAIELDRDGDLVEVITEAVEAAETAGVHILAIAPQTLVTASDIAERTSRTRQSVGQLITGDRGRGGFPPAINPGARHQLWRWSDVSAWFEESDPDDDDLVLEVMNDVVALRAALHRLPKARQTQVLRSNVFRTITELAAAGQQRRPRRRRR